MSGANLAKFLLEPHHDRSDIIYSLMCPLFLCVLKMLSCVTNA